MGKYWKPVERLSSWRKISVGMWAPPDDPTIYGFETLRVDEALEYLQEVEEASGEKVTMSALWVYILGKAIAQHPDLNVMIVNGRIQRRNTVDAFCQVMIPGNNQADLSGIQIRAVDKMDIVEIAKAMRGRAKKVRAGEDQGLEKQKKMIDRVPPWLIRRMIRLVDFLTFNVPVDLDGLGVRSDPFGSFMVSSVATFDIRLGFAPLVPASRTPLVALPGAVFDAPMVIDGEVRACKVMQCGCTFDHRCFDGYQIGMIVKIIRSHVENPRAYLPPPSYWANGGGSDSSVDSSDELKRVEV